MKKSTIVITGCDSNFYPFLEECLSSLLALNIDQKADIGILDMGISQEQKDTLSSMGFLVKTPSWPDYVPDQLRTPHHNIGYVARTELRQYFIGYKHYLWFDADAWAQTPEFFETLVAGAHNTGAAIIREDGTNYKRDFLYSKWWYGNMIKSYGLLDGFKIAVKPSINTGIMCLSDTSLHWNTWKEAYKKSILETNRMNMDQHAFNAANELNELSHYKAPARCNWQPILSTPFWNPDTKMLCEPNKNAIPLSIIHLAGPNKKRLYALQQTSHGFISSSLTYSAVKSLGENHKIEISLGKVA